MTAAEIAALIEALLVAQVPTGNIEDQVRAILSPKAWNEFQKIASRNPNNPDVKKILTELTKGR